MNTNFDGNWLDQTIKVSDLLKLMPNSPLLANLIPKTVAEAFDDFMMDRKLEARSRKTIQFYKEFLKPFVDWVHPNVALSAVTPTQVRTYLKEKQDTHEFAHHSRFRALRAFFNWCVQQHYIASTPLTIKTPKLPSVVMPTFSDSEIEAMLKACSGKMAPRDKAIILTFLDTGMRLSELVGMTSDQLVLEPRIIPRQREREQGKDAHL